MAKTYEYRHYSEMEGWQERNEFWGEFSRLFEQFGITLSCTADFETMQPYIIPQPYLGACLYLTRSQVLELLESCIEQREAHVADARAFLENARESLFPPERCPSCGKEVDEE